MDGYDIHETVVPNDAEGKQKLLLRTQRVTGKSASGVPKNNANIVLWLKGDRDTTQNHKFMINFVCKEHFVKAEPDCLFSLHIFFFFPI